jgi:hypothetical protein
MYMGNVPSSAAAVRMVGCGHRQVGEWGCRELRTGCHVSDECPESILPSEWSAAGIRDCVLVTGCGHEGCCHEVQRLSKTPG